MQLTCGERALSKSRKIGMLAPFSRNAVIN
jgi:hypothetical protein